MLTCLAGQSNDCFSMNSYVEYLVSIYVMKEDGNEDVYFLVIRSFTMKLVALLANEHLCLCKNHDSNIKGISRKPTRISI